MIKKCNKRMNNNIYMRMAKCTIDKWGQGSCGRLVVVFMIVLLKTLFLHITYHNIASVTNYLNDLILQHINPCSLLNHHHILFQSMQNSNFSYLGNWEILYYPFRKYKKLQNL